MDTSTGGNERFCVSKHMFRCIFTLKEKQCKRKTINIYLSRFSKQLKLPNNHLWNLLIRKIPMYPIYSKILIYPKIHRKKQELKSKIIMLRYELNLSIRYFYDCLKQKFKQYTLSSNLISRLQARHDIMQKALGAASANSIEDKK